MQATTATSRRHPRHHQCKQPGVSSSGRAGLLLLGSALALLAVVSLIAIHPAEASIGYFEHYGWPTYGIVKPFWMTPFSAFPSRSISGYSRKHQIYNGRGMLRFNDY